MQFLPNWPLLVLKRDNQNCDGSSLHSSVSAGHKGSLTTARTNPERRCAPLSLPPAVADVWGMMEVGYCLLLPSTILLIFISPGATATTPTPATSGPTTSNPSGSSTTSAGPTQCANEEHDYGEVLRLSLLFYEAQRSGPLPADNRIPWRGDSSLGDVGNNGEDLTGGYHDGGLEHV